MSLGYVSMAQKNFARAAESFGAAVKLQPDSPAARKAVAKAQFLNGQVKEAGAQYEALVQSVS